MEMEARPRGCGYWFHRLDAFFASDDYEPTNINIAHSALIDAGMSIFPSYYSGLPANREYIDEEKLMKIYQDVSQRVDEHSAYAFANMVLDMPSLAPSNIIGATVTLAENDWVYVPDFSEHILEGKTDMRPITLEDLESDEDAMAIAVGSLAALMADEPDESELIREKFRERLAEDMSKIMEAREYFKLSTKQTR